MDKIKNFRITKKALSILTGVIVGFNVASYSANPCKVCAENISDTELEEYLETNDETVSLFSIARPTNSTNSLEYEAATEDNILGDAANWNGFILGDVTNAVDFEGTIAIRGNLSSNGLTVNSVANNVHHKNTDDITLLVGGDININGTGSVWGSTATSNETVTNYYLSNVTESEQTTQGKYLVVDSTQYFEDAEKTLKEANKIIASKEANANYTNNGYGSYNFEGNSEEKELVYTVIENDFYNYNMNFNIDDEQTVVVNLVSDKDINFTNGSVSINGNKDDAYLRSNSEKITINVVNSSNVNVSSTAIYGNFIAPNSDMVGLNANICGTTVVNNLDGTGFEFHVSRPSSGQAVVTPMPEVTSVPVTPMPEVTNVPVTPMPEVTNVPVTPMPQPTRVPQQDIPKTADVTDLVILRDLLLMAGSAYGAKKILCKKKK